MKRCGREMVGQFRDINIFDAQTADDVTRRTEPIQHLLLAGEDYQLDIKRSYIVRMTYDFWEFLLRLSPKDAELIKLTQRYRNLNRRFSALLVDNKIELGQRQCDVQEQVTKFIEDRDQLIKAGKEILHVRRYGLLSPKNWRSGSLRGNEETP